jgi:hypothetical protein
LNDISFFFFSYSKKLSIRLVHARTTCALACAMTSSFCVAMSVRRTSVPYRSPAIGGSLGGSGALDIEVTLSGLHAGCRKQHRDRQRLDFCTWSQHLGN